MTDPSALIARLRAELELERLSNSDLGLCATLFAAIDVSMAVWHVPTDRPGALDLVASNAAADSLLEDADLPAPRVTGDYPIFDSASVLDRLPEVLDAEAPVDLGEFTTPSGSRVYSVNATPLPDRHVGAILFDLTERKRFEEERRHSKRACSTARSSRASASWREGSPTTSTTCSSGSSAM